MALSTSEFIPTGQLRLGKERRSMKFDALGFPIKGETSVVAEVRFTGHFRNAFCAQRKKFSVSDATDAFVFMTLRDFDPDVLFLTLTKGGLGPTPLVDVRDTLAHHVSGHRVLTENPAESNGFFLQYAGEAPRFARLSRTKPGTWTLGAPHLVQVVPQRTHLICSSIHD